VWKLEASRLLAKHVTIDARKISIKIDLKEIE
jgi:hypothetical protein